MKCMTPEELICFAMEPLRSENCPAALHIAGCSRCRDNFQLALESVCEKEYELSAEEETAAENAAAELTGSNAMWNKFFDTVDDLSKKITSPAGNVFKSTSFGSLRSEISVLFAASSGQGAVKLPGPAEDIRFTFESYATPESGSYWKMQMTLPRIPSGSSLISMKVTDSKGAFLDGIMDFLNQRMELRCGLASLPFRVFIENKGCREISFVTRDGVVSPGRIKFLPEALR
ncbi:MAG: hypothetical protein IJV93_07855 [Lentisphaeria bacterium]|nr:hypothetical protein [Lentisphaeria bacterium]